MPVLSAFVGAALDVIYMLLDFYVWLLIIGAVISWLVALNIINTYSRFVQMVSDFINRVTEPALRPIRRYVPPMGGIDFSALILIFIIMFLKSFILRLRF